MKPVWHVCRDKNLKVLEEVVNGYLNEGYKIHGELKFVIVGRDLYYIMEVVK